MRNGSNYVYFSDIHADLDDDFYSAPLAPNDVYAPCSLLQRPRNTAKLADVSLADLFAEADRIGGGYTDRIGGGDSGV